MLDMEIAGSDANSLQVLQCKCQKCSPSSTSLWEIEDPWYMGGSIKGDTPKWMVFIGKCYENGWLGGISVLGNLHIVMDERLFVSGFWQIANRQQHIDEDSPCELGIWQVRTTQQHTRVLKHTGFFHARKNPLAISIYRSIYLSIYLSTYLPTYLPGWPHPSIHPSTLR